MFSLKRGLGSSKGKKKLKTDVSSSAGFGEGSDSDNESDFKSVMAAKLKKVDKLISKKEPIDLEEAKEAKAKVHNKKPGETMEKILEAKRLRDQEHQTIQHRQKANQVKNYLKENTEALVFSTKEYEKQQDESKKLESKIEERDKEVGSFYSSLINSRTGTPTEGVKAETTAVKDVKNVKNETTEKGVKVSNTVTDTTLTKQVLAYIKSKISENDIIELQRKYWERKQIT